MAKPKFKIKHTITKKEWNKTHKDFKSIIDGVHYVMKLTDKGTALVPVNIEESVDENFAVHMAVAKAIKDAKVKNPDTKKDVKVTTALKDKEHPAHKQAKSLFQRIKDRVMGEGMVAPKSGHEFFILTKDTPIKYITGKYGMGLEVPGVLIKNKSGYIDGKKGAYIIVYFGEAFYVDMKKKFASSIYPMKDQDKLRWNSNFTDVDKAPAISDWKKYLKEDVNEGKDPEIITQLRDVVKTGYKTLKDPKSGKRMKVDTYSASAIVGVYDKLNPSNKEKFVKQGLLGMQSLAFKFIK